MELTDAGDELGGIQDSDIFWKPFSFTVVCIFNIAFEKNVSIFNEKNT